MKVADLPKTTVRLEEKKMDYLKRMAKENRRTLNSELAYRLDLTIAAEQQKKAA